MRSVRYFFSQRYAKYGIETQYNSIDSTIVQTTLLIVQSLQMWSLLKLSYFAFVVSAERHTHKFTISPAQVVQNWRDDAHPCFYPCFVRIFMPVGRSIPTKGTYSVFYFIDTYVH